MLDEAKSLFDMVAAAVALVRDFFLDGYIALVCIAITAPLLGALLVVRRVPLLALAVPQFAACGQAAIFWVFPVFVATFSDGVLPEPSAFLQTVASIAAVGLGMLLLFAGSARDLGSRAAIAFLVAIALRDVFFLHSPYNEVFEDLTQRGRLLTVDGARRNTVAIVSALALSFVVAVRRRNLIAAFDPDQARLLGVRPGTQRLATLLVFGLYAAIVVPIVDASVVLVLALVPPIVMRAATPSLAAYLPLSVGASVVGAQLALLFACMEGVDWPPAPALTIIVTLTSLLLALPCWLLRAHRWRAARPR